MNVNGMVDLLNRTIKNLLHNFIPHEIFTYDDIDPPRINNSIRCLIQDKNEPYKRFKESSSNKQHFKNIQSLQNFLGASIEASKQRYYSRLSKKLMERCTSPKACGSVLKSFPDNLKIPFISPRKQIFSRKQICSQFQRKRRII